GRHRRVEVELGEELGEYLAELFETGGDLPDLLLRGAADEGEVLRPDARPGLLGGHRLCREQHSERGDEGAYVWGLHYFVSVCLCEAFGCKEKQQESCEGDEFQRSTPGVEGRRKGTAKL